MKNTLLYLGVIGASCSYSFWKMDQSSVYINSGQPNGKFNYIGEINQFDFDDYTKGINKKSSLAYWHDEYSGFGLYRLDTNMFFYNTFQNEESKKNYFDYFANNLRIEENIWPKLIKNKQAIQAWQPKGFYFKKNEEDQRELKDIIECNSEKADPLSDYQVEDFEYNSWYCSDSGVRIKNTPSVVKLEKTQANGKIKVIDFEVAFKNYVKKNVAYGEKIAPIVSHIQNRIENEGDNAKIADLTADISKKSKIIFTSLERDLLDRSKILAIWPLLPSKYSNKHYFKKASEKTMNRILIGLARDVDTGRFFHWVTDLGQDIEVLFDVK